MIEYKISQIIDKRNKAIVKCRLFNIRFPEIPMEKISVFRDKDFDTIEFTIDHYPVTKQEIEDKITEIINLVKGEDERLEQTFPKY